VYTHKYVCAPTLEAAAPTVHGLATGLEMIKTLTYLIPDK